MRTALNHCRGLRSPIHVFQLALLFVALLQPNHVLGFASVGPPMVNTTKPRAFVGRSGSGMTSSSTIQLSLSLSDESATNKRIQLLNGGTGSLVFAGGLAGYVAKGSKVSLVMGSTMGGLLLLSALLVSSSTTKSKKVVGNTVGTTVAGLLTYVMGKKFAKSRALFPPGVLLVLGGLSFVNGVLAMLIRPSSSSPEDDSNEKKSESAE